MIGKIKSYNHDSLIIKLFNYSIYTLSNNSILINDREFKIINKNMDKEVITVRQKNKKLPFCADKFCGKDEVIIKAI